MTTKTIKTILFASLLVAMILPFSAMEFAEAAPNDKANDKAKAKANDKGKANDHDNPNGFAEMKKMRDKGYKLFPGVGWIHANENSNVKSKYIQHSEKPGVMLLDLDAMEESIIKNYKAKKANENDEVFPSHNGYNLAAVKQERNSMTYFNGYWKVPAEPDSWSGGTIFYFDALQPFAGVIFQPVLQYGNSGICNAGDKWVTYALIFINSNAYIATPCMDADVGDTIKGKISKSGSTWTVYLKNYGTGNSAQVQIGYSGKADTALVALETYNLSRNCSSLPGDERFYSMYIAGDSVAWKDGSEVSQWCGMDVNITNDRTVELNNNS